MKPINYVSYDVPLRKQGIDNVFMYLLNCSIGRCQKQGMRVSQYIHSNLLFCHSIIMKRHEGVSI